MSATTLQQTKKICRGEWLFMRCCSNNPLQHLYSILNMPAFSTICPFRGAQTRVSPPLTGQYPLCKMQRMNSSNMTFEVRTPRRELQPVWSMNRKWRNSYQICSEVNSTVFGWGLSQVSMHSLKRFRTMTSMDITQLKHYFQKAKPNNSCSIHKCRKS